MQYIQKYLFVLVLLYVTKQYRMITVFTDK